MATKPRGFGMTAEIQKKIAASFDPVKANQVFDWMRAILEQAGSESGKKLPNVEVMDDVFKCLHDGQIICEVINVMYPGSVKKINKGKQPFVQMENISNFVGACVAGGKCAKADLFTTPDLYEKGNIPQVVNGLCAMAMLSHECGKDVPTYGPKKSTENKREFTEEQLKAGEHIIGLQSGTNKGASQAGMSFGAGRQVVEQKKDEEE